MIPLTLDEMAGLVGGRLHDVPDPGARVTGTVEFDSRRVGPGGLFVALPGEHADGHDYAAAAVAAGAAAVLAARPVGVPAVVVPDVLAALAALARAVLDRLPDLTVIGLTGSSGKTSTKDLLAQVLARLGPTVAPPGSFNNELGHPYTVLRADASTRYLVLENSARGLGHIAQLCRIARPRIGVVLNVGTAHLGEFGSKEVVARAKGELVEALPEDGVAVLNADDPLVSAMAGRTAARVVRFGTGPATGGSNGRGAGVNAGGADSGQAGGDLDPRGDPDLRGDPDPRSTGIDVRGAGIDVRATGVGTDERGRPYFTLHARGGAAPVRLGLYGEHHVSNALAAATVALELGMPLAGVAQALSAARPLSRWRMEVTERPDGVTVVNDAYNANPESMRAALDALTRIAAGRRTWAVLGQMAELGVSANAEHDAIGRFAARSGVSRLVVVGEEAGPLHAGAVREGADSVRVPDVAAAVGLLRGALRPADVVLVKASRAAGLERVALALLEPAQGGGSGR